MASPSVLREAIQALERCNYSLVDKLLTARTEAEREEINKRISKNKSMMLDYKFRLSSGNFN